MSEYFPLLLALLFIVVAFLMASRNGVISLLSSGIALAGALALLFFSFQKIPDLGRTFLDVDLSWRVVFGTSMVLAVVLFLVLRISLSPAITRFFNPDSQFHRFVDGNGGGFLSLLPSLVAVFVFFTCLRAAGTVQELNYIDSLTQEGIEGAKVPAYPFTARWRNGIERIPFLVPLLDATDPFSRRASRNAAVFVLAQKGEALRTFLASRPETERIIRGPRWAQLLEDPAVEPSLTSLDRVGLVLSPPVVELAHDPAAAEILAPLQFAPILQDFVKALRKDQSESPPAATPES